MKKDNILTITKNTQDRWLNLPRPRYKIELNTRLIDEKEVSQEDIGNIFKYHGQKCSIFDKARTFLVGQAARGYFTKNTKKEIEKIKDDIENLEYRAQTAWGFPTDANYHNWWMELPGCTCPIMDNMERTGVTGYIYAGDCPWHGWFDTNRTEI